MSNYQKSADNSAEATPSGRDPADGAPRESTEEKEETSLLREDVHERPAGEAEQQVDEARDADQPPDSLGSARAPQRGNTGDPQVPRTSDKREDVAKAQSSAGGVEPRQPAPETNPRAAHADPEEDRVRNGDRKRGRDT